MNQYEVLYILQNDLSEERKLEMIEKIGSIIEKLNGNVKNVDKWGTRRYAYPINDKNEGYYVLMNFEAAPDVPQEFERQMRIMEEVVRFMLTRKE